MPAYRHLSDDEKISMRQCVDVLGGHDIIVIHPERLDLTEDLQSWQSVVVKALCNEWFDGVKGYFFLPRITNNLPTAFVDNLLKTLFLNAH